MNTSMPRRPLWVALDRVWRPLILCVAVALSARVALQSPVGWHPDEAAHLDAMEWFYGHPGVPALDSGGLAYSPDGWSRVWTGELVYPLIGRGAALWHRLTGLRPTAVFPRLFDTSLLLLLLVPLLWGRARLFNLPAVGALMAGVPQLLYVFGYANSDAWAVAVSTLLLLCALRSLEGGWRVDWLLAGALSALVLTSKMNAWFVLPAAWAMLWTGWRNGLGRPWLRLAGAAVLAAGLAAPILLAPRLAEPGNWATAVRTQRAHRAWPSFNPEHPTYPTFHLRDRGKPLSSALADLDWYGTTCLSTWADFGYMNTTPPRAVRAAEGLVLLGLLGLTVLALRRDGREAAARRTRLATVAVAAGTLAILLAASIAHSWIVDYQPQGRYLLPGILLYTVVLGGTPAGGTSRAARLQKGLIAVHVALGWAVAFYLGGHITPP